MKFPVFALITIVSTISQAGPQTGQVISADEHADIYAIYSILMTDPKTSHGPTKDEVYLIAGTTRAVRPVEPCVRVPPKYEKAYQEALNEYHRRKDKPVKVERALTIMKPYELLNPDEVSQFQEAHSLRPTPASNPPLQTKATDLYWLGDVYFDQAHTIALTAISTWCGSLCGSMSWKMFEKSSTGRWEERPWVTCRGIS